jgi:hypothetical protein
MGWSLPGLSHPLNDRLLLETRKIIAHQRVKAEDQELSQFGDRIESVQLIPAVATIS